MSAAAEGQGKEYALARRRAIEAADNATTISHHNFGSRE
jgi:hypothetical protein